MSARPPAATGARRSRLPFLLAIPLVLVLGVQMLGGVRGLPDGPLGMAGEVEARLEESGVQHPVTAVLLNLRAYDTWLEVLALLMVAVATLATRATALPSREGQGGAVLAGLVRRLLPLIVLVGVFVLALGAFAPGGAFQAGALVAAGLFLLHLAGVPLGRALVGRGGQVLLVLGTLAFLVAALAGLVAGYHVLELPPRIASSAILAVETAVTVSIVLTLVILLIAAEPDASEEPEA